MYPFYNYPSSSYGSSYSSYPSSSSDAEYLRALAEERAAREQYAAARRAQEEARQRAARARAARRAYAAPYSSFHDEDYNDLDLDMDLDDGAYYSQRPLSYADSQRPYGYPSTPQFSSIPAYQSGPQFSTSPQYSSSPYGLNARQRALLEEQRRRELLEEQRRRELLELERERRRQEDERLRRIIQEERQREEAERRKLLEEERMRRAMEEEKLRRAIEEEKLRRAMLEEEAARRERERAQLRAQQATLEPLLRAFGFVPVGSDSDSDKERPSRDARNGRAARARTMSPTPHRASAAPRSPVRPTKSPQPTTAYSQRRPGVSPSPVAKPPSPTPATTIPITSPKPSPKTAPAKPQPEQEAPKQQEVPKATIPPLDNPTPEQVAAAEKIQDAYRTFSARKAALKSIATLRRRFLAAKANFTLPTTLDYETSSGAEQPPTTVTVDPSAALPSPSLSAVDQHEDPFQHVPKLAYTPTNASLHAYEEELNRILSALDAVESRGDAGVRAARRELARMVEREAERVERWRGVVWNWWTGRQAQLAQNQPQPEQSSAKESEAVAESSVDGAPAQRDEPISVDQAAPAPKEPEMQVEPSEEPSEQAMETEVTEESTPKAIPMEVEREAEPADIEVEDASSPSAVAPVDGPTSEKAAATVGSAVPAEQPHTPEIDIPDADVDASAPPVNIEVEPPSRAEPAAVQDVGSEAPTTGEIAPELPAIEVTEPSSVVSEPERASTPPLSLDHGETDAEMDVEPQEVHTPPPGDHAPLVAGSPPALDLHGSGEKELAVPTEGQQASEVAQRQEQPQKTQEQRRPPPTGGASPLVNRDWEEFRSYDMF
ncbi:hypothetical protein OH77DRAFT_1426391 [Trametes cingulata]|nr:hypothetical protein OH77DRAFT_1426391 [Trametes cingulata]